MSKGRYRIAEQVQNYGIYGELGLICELTDDTDKIDIILSNDLEKWKPGILFGATYFLENVILDKGLSITLDEINFNEVDTNNTVIAFLTVHALIEATGIKIKTAPFFDIATMGFIFPK